ncbi:MAG: hypothetical protein ABIG44_09220 [Planctomycetota bacterium]
MRRIFDFFHIDDIPALARPNYIAELKQMSLWGFLVGAVEGNMAGVVASKTFNASPLLTSIIWALPILINVLNPVWSNIIRGRPRARMFVILVSGASLGTLSVGLTSTEWKSWAALIFALQIGFTHLFLSGLITLRTAMWKVNYPQAQRASIAGRLQKLRILLSLLTSVALGALFNKNPELYRFVYPTMAILGLLSLWPIRRLRMRGEPTELRRFQAHLARNNGNENGRITLWQGLKESAAILRDDRPYARYMLAQFLLGSANFFTDPLLLIMLTKELEFSYSSSILLLFQVPTVLLLVSIRYWAKLFDRIGVLRFRIYNSACWAGAYLGVVISMAIIGLGGAELLPLALIVLTLSRVLNGLGRGGGAIAWNLGHLHFAREHQTELYMGIHVGLTGIRGLTMPLLAWAVSQYLLWASFGLPLLSATVAHIMFRRMAAADQQPSRECAPDREEPSGPRPDIT